MKWTTSAVSPWLSQWNRLVSSKQMSKIKQPEAGVYPHTKSSPRSKSNCNKHQSRMSRVNPVSWKSLLYSATASLFWEKCDASWIHTNIENGNIFLECICQVAKCSLTTYLIFPSVTDWVAEVCQEDGQYLNPLLLIAFQRAEFASSLSLSPPS